MRVFPTAVGHVDVERSGRAAQWNRAQIARLARRLGYILIWPSDASPLPLLDQVRAADVDAVLIPSLQHIDAFTLDQLTSCCDVECVSPRKTIARYVGEVHGCPA